GPTEAELQEAKNYLIGSYPLRFTTSSRIAGQLLGIQLDDLGIDYVDRRNEMIDDLTIEDVSAAAARLFADGELTIVRVGQPSS
ncbi:MAG: insulinase family protein, partial [Alphaproteobacteria bacterium]